MQSRRTQPSPKAASVLLTVGPPRARLSTGDRRDLPIDRQGERNLAKGIDLAVRPRPTGLATFVQFRAGAPHSLRWRLSLRGDERVVGQFEAWA